MSDKQFLSLARVTVDIKLKLRKVQCRPCSMCLSCVFHARWACTDVRVIAKNVRDSVTKQRKGDEAITQVAFTISLMEHCAKNESAHPSFTILDSSLLSRKEPDGPEDYLSPTDLNGNFYRFLLQLDAGRQIIIVENKDPPSDVELGKRVEQLSGMEGEDRLGLFQV